jgi:hypothetical protein
MWATRQLRATEKPHVSQKKDMWANTEEAREHAAVMVVTDY